MEPVPMLSLIPLRAMPRAQSGVMLIISLIVLVAMTLAGIAMMRSIDTATMVAGNISFKQSTTNAADQGLQAGYSWLATVSGTTALYSDNNAVGSSSVGYFSSAPVIEPDWNNSASWTNAAVLNAGSPDAAGNVVSYLVHRMCPCAGVAPNSTCAGGATTNVCGSTPDTAAVSGEGTEQSSPNFFTRQPATHYRVTARAVGPRNSVTIVQSMLRTQ
jgi:type IV pilus assembly protein PilX